jgi:hypothetical protein
VRQHWRDLFYGQLEYAARTLILRKEKTVDSVLIHLKQVIETALVDTTGNGKSRNENEGSDVESRLFGIEKKLDQLIKQR